MFLNGKEFDTSRPTYTLNTNFFQYASNLSIYLPVVDFYYGISQLYTSVIPLHLVHYDLFYKKITSVRFVFCKECVLFVMRHRSTNHVWYFSIIVDLVDEDHDSVPSKSMTNMSTRSSRVGRP